MRRPYYLHSKGKIYRCLGPMRLRVPHDQAIRHLGDLLVRLRRAGRREHRQRLSARIGDLRAAILLLERGGYPLRKAA